MVYVHVVRKDIICNYVIMCMHDIIVIDDSNVEHEDRQSWPGQDVPATCDICVYCSLFPVFLVNPACSVCSVVYAVARQELCRMVI